MASGNFLRVLRISLMFYLLVFVAVGAWLAKARSTDWNDTLWVAVYPIDGDGSAVTGKYLDSLVPAVFAPLETFLEREASRFGVTLAKPVHIALGEPLTEIPPPPPSAGNIPAVMLWSLRLRWWAHRMQASQDGPTPDIRLFVVYHDPDRHPRLAHSLGLEKGLIGVVNAFASRRDAGGNNVVIAHEMLHTLGATDKYDPATTLPRHPDGYAEPGRQPLYPQPAAEIMGGRIPLSPTRADIPRRLTQVVVGPLTAAEINWLPRH